MKYSKVNHTAKTIYSYTCLCGEKIEMEGINLKSWGRKAKCSKCGREGFIKYSMVGNDSQKLIEEVYIEDEPSEE